MPDKVYPLTLESEAFAGLKRDFDVLLERTLSAMRQKDGQRAELKLSLKITLMEGFIDAEEEGSMREVVMPKFEHKISTVLQYKDELSGILGGSEFELAWDEATGTWAIRPIDDKQMSLFDEGFADV